MISHMVIIIGDKLCAEDGSALPAAFELESYVICAIKETGAAPSDPTYGWG